MPTSQDLAIFVPMTTTDIQTDHFTPCACVWGNETLLVMTHLQLEMATVLWQGKPIKLALSLGPSPAYQACNTEKVYYRNIPGDEAKGKKN